MKILYRWKTLLGNPNILKLNLEEHQSSWRRSLPLQQMKLKNANLRRKLSSLLLLRWDISLFKLLCLLLFNITYKFKFHNRHVEIILHQIASKDAHLVFGFQRTVLVIFCNDLNSKIQIIGDMVFKHLI